MNEMNCDLVLTGGYFNGKPIYKCDYCGITLSLEKPDTNMLCFKKMIDTKNTIRKMHNAPSLDIDITTPQNLKDFIQDKIQEKSLNPEIQHDMCSNEQISERLKVCSDCEHYNNEMCELCGCKIVREQNYMNKLAHKSASCPVDKWLPIID